MLQYTGTSSVDTQVMSKNSLSIQHHSQTIRLESELPRVWLLSYHQAHVGKLWAASTWTPALQHTGTEDCPCNKKSTSNHGNRPCAQTVLSHR